MKIIFCILLSFYSAICYADDLKTDFEYWVLNFKEIAPKKYKIHPNVLEAAFADVVFNEKVVALDRKQPEFVKTFKDYYSDAINKNRIEKGKKQIEKHRAILEKKRAKKYNVPYYLIVAFWDLETHFGNNMGKSNAISVLANMAFDKRRTTFFTEELVFALKIVQNKKIKLKDFKSSWAGAFGNFQFMPSTYTKYAVDGDGDGKIDLYNSIPDAIFSATNFISKMGWDGKYRWGRPVVFDTSNEVLWDLVNSKEWKDLNYYIANGVKSYNGKNIQKANIKAKLIAPMGKNGPTFLIYENFKAIMRWNNSTNYALNVGLLSDAYVYDEVLKFEK